jgi:hypothetical protein
MPRVLTGVGMFRRIVAAPELCGYTYPAYIYNMTMVVAREGVKGMPGMNEAETLRSEEQAAGPTSGADSSSRSSSRRHGSRHHRSRRSSRSLLPVIALTAVGAVAVISLLLYLFGTIARYGSENNLQRAELSQKESELRDLRAELKRVTAEFDALVKERLPNLKALERDKVIPLNQGYVRNILFTETHSGDKIGYEYRIVVENNQSRPAMPAVRVMLFDRTGVQIGGASVQGVPLMRTGDSESFSGEVDLSIDAVPEYFYVESRSN